MATKPKDKPAKSVSEIFGRARAKAQESTGQFLSKSDKEDMIEEGTTFTLTAVEHKPGRYGSRWVHTIEIEGEVSKFSLPDNDFRTSLYNELKSQLPLENMKLTKNTNVEGEPYDVVPADFQYEEA